MTLEAWEIEVRDEATSKGLSLARTENLRDPKTIETYEIHQDQEKVEGMISALRRGEKLPPIHCTREGKLLDGHHRLLAHVAVHGWDTPIATIEYASDTYWFLKEECDMGDLDIIELIERLASTSGFHA